MASMSDNLLKAALQPPENDETDPFSDGTEGEPGEDMPSLMPLLPLDGMVLFPYTMTSLTLEDEAEIELTEEVTAGDRLVAFAPLKPGVSEPEGADSFVEFGCLGRIVKMLRFPDDTVRILVRGIRRVALLSVGETDGQFEALVQTVEEPVPDTDQLEALSRNVRMQFQEIIGLSPQLPEELQVALFNIDDKGRMADLIADTINLSYEEKLAVLGALDVEQRLGVIMSVMTREVNVLQLGQEIQSQVNNAFEEQQREHFLREQLRAIQEQLGQEEDSPEIAELRARLDEVTLPEEAKEVAERELGRLNRMHPAAPDYNVARTYFEWLLALPWNDCTKDQLKLDRARRILNRDHYDLERIKERIVEHLAVMRLKRDSTSPILCFVGPPGVGKTSLGKAIANAMGRKFVRMSLGGIRDEAEIRGHRRTYVGALPGRIIQGIRRAGSANPVVMLDEIDKVGMDFRGDPSSALLEVLDPEQNNAFSDHYLEVPFDLSRVMFITTANVLDPIPPALLDRMEVLRIPGYTRQEKHKIARKFLLPRQLDASGVTRKQLRLTSHALDGIIGGYTREAGVRNLERELGRVCRKHARKLVDGDVEEGQQSSIGRGDLTEYLGPPREFADELPESALSGLAIGLAWTTAGGETLQIEATSVPGDGKLVLTGCLGDVMKESARIALTFVRNCAEPLGFDPDWLSKRDVHIHVPAGAIPKDGPSAGLALATALSSMLTNRPVLPKVAMTGELSLRGRVLPVGGIKEKVLAAVRAGVAVVYLPEKNKSDLREIPEDLLEKVEIRTASEALPVIRHCLSRLAEQA